MRNSRKMLSLVMIAIFTVFIVLSSMPAGAITNAQAAKNQITNATKYVVTAETMVKPSDFTVTDAQAAYNSALSQVKKILSYGTAYKTNYNTLIKRLSAVQTKISTVKKAQTEAAAKLNLVSDAVNSLEAFTMPGSYDLVNDPTALTQAKSAVNNALAAITVLDPNSSDSKGFKARINAANNIITKAATTASDAAVETAAVAKAEASVRAAEAAPSSTTSDVTAAQALVKAAATDVAAVKEADKAKTFSDRLQAVTTKLTAASAPAKIATVNASNGSVKITFNKVPVNVPAAADFKVLVSINNAAATVITPSNISNSGNTVTLSVPAIVQTASDQNVVYSVVYKADAAVAAVAFMIAKTPNLLISSVQFANKGQILVTFNQAVDKATAENYAYYMLNGVALGSNCVLALQSDGTSVLITGGTAGGFIAGPSTAITTGVGYVLAVSGVKSLDASKTAVNLQSISFSFIDTTSPALTDVIARASASTSTVKVVYNEPVQGIGLYTINGLAASNIQIDYSTNSITLTSPTALVGNTQYTLQVFNEKDLAGNTLAQNPSVKAFSVTIVRDAPTVTAKVSSDNKINLTFSTSMNPSSLRYTSNIKILNGNAVNITTLGASVNIDYHTNPDNSSNTLFDITIGSASALFANGVTNVPLTLIFTNYITDSLGNTMNPISIPITLALNQTIPVITSAQWLPVNSAYDNYIYGSGAVVLTFNEPVTSASPSFTGITDTGAIDPYFVSMSYVRSNSTDPKTLVFIPNHIPTGTNTETIRFNASQFTDTTLAANKNNSQVVTLDLKNNTLSTSTNDYTAPVVGNAYVNGSTIVVDLGEKMATLDSSTVLNPASYTLNGKAFGNGTYITVIPGGTTDFAVVNYAENSIPASAWFAFTVSGIKDKAGNVATTKVTPLQLVKNTRPTLNSLKFNSDGTLTIGFDSNVAWVIANDFVVRLNGSAPLSPGANYTVQAGVGADSGKVVLTFTAPPIPGTVVSVATSQTVSGRDSDTSVVNYLMPNITLTVTK